LQIQEVPITFVERAKGKSKMSFEIVVEAFSKVTQWGFARLINRR
jgi:dolichol-phosphate mannosyltransferase